MCRNRAAFLALVGFALLLGLNACGPTASRSDQQDEKNPYFMKAKKMYQSHDYKEAVKFYQMALEQDPNNAAAHLELGLLYEDKLQDYAYAIYHYRRYLELRPTAEKADLVKQFVDRSQLAFASSVAHSPLDSGEEIARLRQESSNLLQQVEYLSKSNQELQQKLAKVSRAPDETQPVQVVTQFVVAANNSNQNSGTANLTPPVTNKPPTHVTSSTTAASNTSRPRTYVVQPHDTLSAISQKMYGRRDKWQLIYSANKSVVGPPPIYRLKVGQTITIPKL